MIEVILFSIFASVAVWFAGKKDPALDPRLTTIVLVLVGALPVMMYVMPKWILIHRAEDTGSYVWWKLALLGIWLTGFIVEMKRLIRAWYVIHGWREESALITTVDGVEIRKRVELCGPVAAGVFKPVVLVPEAWEKWDRGVQDIVLQHELAHHRRRDPLRRWIAGIAIAVNWFNPLVRWMVRRLLIQCEFSCDQQVLMSGVNARHYAETLCDLAEGESMRGPALAMAEHQGLESRVRRILRDDEHQSTARAGWLILLSMLMAGALSMIGGQTIAGYTRSEVELRRTANPFPDAP